jgi:hypothetical protein
MHNAHEGPVVVAKRAAVELSRGRDVAHNSVWADQVDTEVAAAFVFHIHSDGYMFKLLHIGVPQHGFSNFKGRHETMVPLRDIVVHVDPGREEPGLRLDILPALRSLDERFGIDLAISKGVAELLANARGLRFRSIPVNGYGAFHGNVLHITPAKVRSYLEDERKDTSSKWSCSRRTAMGHCCK